MLLFVSLRQHFVTLGSLGKVQKVPNVIVLKSQLTVIPRTASKRLRGVFDEAFQF